MLFKQPITKEWTLFLDRDGVINKRNFEGYVTTPSEFEFLPHAIEGIVELSHLFGRIIVVTNQQGIGKKIMTERNLSAIHDYMLEKIHENGGNISEVFYAANLKGGPNDRRKPLPNMGIEAQQKYPEIDFKKSIMVGDTDSDLRFGMNLGMFTVLVKSKEMIGEKYDLKVDNLVQLVKKIKQ